MLTRKPTAPLPEKQFQLGLRTLRQNKGLREAAKAAGVSPERFKYEASKKEALVKNGRKWVVNPDLPRRVPIYTRKRLKAILVDTPTASAVGRFMSSVGRFSRTRDRSLVTAYSGQGVTDISGKRHPFETDPNELYRLTLAEDATFEQIYRIVI